MKTLLTFILSILNLCITIKVGFLIYKSYISSFEITDELMWWMCLLIFDNWVLSKFAGQKMDV
jgi:hypothetical protein